eukprot:tig00021238_g19553.t1
MRAAPAPGGPSRPAAAKPPMLNAAGLKGGALTAKQVQRLGGKKPVKSAGRNASSSAPADAPIAVGGFSKQTQELTAALAAAVPEAPAWRFPATKEGYEWLEKLGEGGFGSAWKVKRKSDGAVFVCKTMKVTEMGRNTLEAAVNEVKILASCNSPFVIRYYTSFVQDDTIHIIMEYAERGTLAQKLRAQSHAGFFPEITVWRYFIQIALGLWHIHSKHVIHRDVKPSNVLVDADDTLKLSDVGWAMEMTQRRVWTGLRVGTLIYISPEVSAGRPYNEASDVWALGCTLYELAALRHAFGAANKHALFAAIQKGAYKPISKRYSPELAALVAACLTLDPAARPTLPDILTRPEVAAKARVLGIPLPDLAPPPRPSRPPSAVRIGPGALEIIPPAPAPPARAPRARGTPGPLPRSPASAASSSAPAPAPGRASASEPPQSPSDPAQPPKTLMERYHELRTGRRLEWVARAMLRWGIAAEPAAVRGLQSVEGRARADDRLRRIEAALREAVGDVSGDYASRFGPDEAFVRALDAFSYVAAFNKFGGQPVPSLLAACGERAERVAAGAAEAQRAMEEGEARFPDMFRMLYRLVQECLNPAGASPQRPTPAAPQQ